jgi:hypothetical protein
VKSPSGHGPFATLERERKKEMTSYPKSQRADEYATEYATERVPAQSPRLTSVNAHTMLSIVVSMSVVEMEKLIETFGVADVNLQDSDRVLQREFADAVRALR